MKKPLLVILSTLLISLSLVSLNSCKEPCEDYCENGYCITGDCDCKLGWIGDACDEVDPDYNPNTTKGFASFFQNGNIDCGPILVNVNQNWQIVNSASITQFYPSGIDVCDIPGCANFTLEVGSYAYMASDTCGNSWSDSLKIQVKSCDRILLN